MSAQGSTRNIDEYLKDYTNKHEPFKQVAKYVEDACRSELQTGAIMGNVTSRAKDPDRYRDKLKKMKSGNDFPSISALEDEIVDIIGVRITLYFPSQVPEVVNKLQTLFSGAKPDVDIKQITDSNKATTGQDLLKLFAEDKVFLAMNSRLSSVPEVKDYKPHRYGDYRAVHLRFELKVDDLGTELQKALGERRLKVEIQIQTLLMHAWSEVNHDLAYKTLGGEVSQKETHLLDLLNGIGKMGELVLLHLKGALGYRLKQNSVKTEFASVYELAEFMRSQTLEGPQPCILGDVEDFRDFLISAKKNNREIIEQEFVKWQKVKTTGSPMVNIILGQMLVKDGLNEQPFSATRPFLLAEQNKAFPEQNTYEILATIIDLTLRPYIQSMPKNTSESVVSAFKALRDKDKIYKNTLPAMPRVAYTINRTVLLDKAVRLRVVDIVDTLTVKADMVPLIQYYLRLGRIRAWRIYTNKDLMKAFI